LNYRDVEKLELKENHCKMTKDKKKADLENQEVENTVNESTEENKNETVEETIVEEEEKSPEEVLELKLKDITDKYLRLNAEFDNYRKRTLKEKMELTKSAGEKILVNILPVMDNFERAISSMKDAKDVNSVKEGVDLIFSNFKEFMTQNGVKEIEAVNSNFDTDLHEAITKIPAPSKKMKGKVIDCVEKGYLLNEKVVRFSKVVVGE